MEKIRLKMTKEGAVVPLSEARKIVNFELTYMPYVLLILEKKAESDEHLILKEASRKWFRDNYYSIGRAKVGVKGLKVYSDYFVVTPWRTFEFVECLTESGLGDFKKKLELTKVAPLWLVLPRTVRTDAVNVIQMTVSLTLRTVVGLDWGWQETYKVHQRGS